MIYKYITMITESKFDNLIKHPDLQIMSCQK